MMLWGRLAFVAALLLAASVSVRAEGPACGALPEALEAGPLPGTAAALGRKNLRVMIVGSASTQSGGTSGPAATWPERLARLLQARYPDTTFEFRTYGGRHAARGERTDVVLMDPQFSRFLRANADVDRYREKLQLASAAAGAQLFSRWDIMKNWSESDRLDLERAPRELRTRIADELHDCLARALVAFVDNGAQAARR
jgi:signal transduction histidine kinase